MLNPIPTTNNNIQQRPHQTVPRTPKGLSYFHEWAANRFAANAAFTALVAAELGLNPGPYREYATGQIQ